MDISEEEALALIEAARELKEAHEQKPQLESLLAHPGWGILSAIAKAQIEARQRKVMGGPVGKNGVSINEQEWLKGEASGMRLLLGLPDLIIEQATLTIQENTDDAPLDATKSGNSDDGDDPFPADA